jgi:hypothetical protein
MMGAGIGLLLGSLAGFGPRGEVLGGLSRLASHWGADSMRSENRDRQTWSRVLSPRSPGVESSAKHGQRLFD